MQVLFDNGVPRGVASVLKEHVVEEARDRGWDRLTNGDLLSAAEAAGFEILVTTDRNIRHQQNLSKRVIGTHSPGAVGDSCRDARREVSPALGRGHDPPRGRDSRLDIPHAGRRCPPLAIPQGRS